jgi:hypothetical protein
MSYADLEDTNHAEYRRFEFHLPSCGYLLKPQQGTVIVLDCAKISHGTIANSSYSQYGVALTMKKKVVTGGKKLMGKYGLDFTV